MGMFNFSEWAGEGVGNTEVAPTKDAGILNDITGGEEKSGGSAFSSDYGGMANAAGGFFGAGMGLIDDINLSTAERMDEQGQVTHDVDWGGNISSMVMETSKLGGSIVPGWGHLFGAIAGLEMGIKGSLHDQSKQPNLNDVFARKGLWDMGNQVRGVRAEDNYAKSGYMAEEGMNVQGDTKQIEVEQDELVLRKSGKVFTKVADFKGGKPHEMGGEQYTAQEGDVIIPGKHRTKVNRMLSNRRWSAIESLRQSLPTDTGQEMAAVGMTVGDPTDPDKKKRAGMAVSDSTINSINTLDRIALGDKEANAMYTNNPNDMLEQAKRVPSLNLGKYGKFFTAGSGTSSTGSVNNIYDVNQVGKQYNDRAFKENIWQDIQSLNPNASVRYNGKIYQAAMNNKYTPAKSYAKGTKSVSTNMYAEGTSSIGNDPIPGAKKFMAQEGVSERMQIIADKYGFSVESLLKAMYKESSFKTTAKNKSGATGLIQFMPKSAKSVGTTTSALEKMSVLAQLEYVDKYFEKNHKEGVNPYLTIAAPGYATKSENTVVYRKGSTAAKQNPEWTDENGNVTVGSLNKFSGVKSKYPKELIKEYSIEVLDNLPEDVVNRLKRNLDIAGADISYNKPLSKSKKKQLGEMLMQDIENRGKYSSVLPGEDPLADNKKSIKELQKKGNLIDFLTADDIEAIRIAKEKVKSGNYETREEKNIQEQGYSEPIKKKVIPRDKVEAIVGPDKAGMDEPGLAPIVTNNWTPEEPLDTSPTIGDKVDKAAGILGQVSRYSPAIYNLARGLEKADKVPRNFIKPQTRTYENISQPQMNAIDQAFEGSMSDARNLSGGMMSNYRSNVEAAWADKISNQAKVNAFEAGRSDQIANQNIDITNQADQFNTQINNKADIMDMQSEASTKAFFAQGMQDIANIGSVSRKDTTSRGNQNMILSMLEDEFKS